MRQFHEKQLSWHKNTDDRRDAGAAGLFRPSDLPLFRGPADHHPGVQLPGGGERQPVRLCGAAGAGDARRGQRLAAPPAGGGRAGQPGRRRGVRLRRPVVPGPPDGDRRPGGPHRAASIRPGSGGKHRGVQKTGQPDHAEHPGVSKVSGGGPAGEGRDLRRPAPGPGAETGLQLFGERGLFRPDPGAAEPAQGAEESGGGLCADHHRPGFRAVLRRGGRV